MKAILITPASRSLEPIEMTGQEDIARLVGFDTIESDAVGEEGDRIFFDEECFLLGTAGRFQVGSLAPISGRAVVVGTSGDPAELRDIVTDLEGLRVRIRFL